MDINEKEEQIEEEMEQLSPDVEELAASDTGEPVEAEQEELVAAETEELDAVDTDEPVEAEQAELDEPVAAETENVVEAETDESVAVELDESVTPDEAVEPTAVEAEDSVTAEQEEPAAIEVDEPIESEPEEIVETETDESEEDELVGSEAEEPVLAESELSTEYSVIPDPVKDDGRAWYVVHCYSGNEDKVRHNILQRIESMSMDDLIFDVVVPTEDEVNIKNGERQTVEKKVFPGYILVYMILTEDSWYMVRNTPGVTGFVGMGNDPTPLQPEEVARILKRMESESPRINVTFRQGERVRIVDGPFEDFYGKVSEIDMERATVRVMVNFFGRETPVELDFLQVEEA
jgi:transcriptional antiterminator NusG